MSEVNFSMVFTFRKSRNSRDHGIAYDQENKKKNMIPELSTDIMPQIEVLWCYLELITQRIQRVTRHVVVP